MNKVYSFKHRWKRNEQARQRRANKKAAEKLTEAQAEHPVKVKATPKVIAHRETTHFVPDIANREFSGDGLRTEAPSYDDTKSMGSPSSSDSEDEQQVSTPLTSVSYIEPLSLAYMDDFGQSADMRKELLSSQAMKVIEAARCASQRCPSCKGLGQAHGQPCPVTVLFWDQAVSLRVPVWWCPACKSSYGIRPTVLDSIPDTNISMNIQLRKDGTHVIWWHQTLLQLFDILESTTRHISADRFCAALMVNWEENGFGKPDSVIPSTLRKRFRHALKAYHYLQGLVDDSPEALDGWPSGALNGCPCCGDPVSENWQSNQDARREQLAPEDNSGVRIDASRIPPVAEGGGGAGTSGGEPLAPGQHSAGGCSDTASILRVATVTVGRGGGAGTSGGELLPAPPPAWGRDGVARIPPVAEGGGGAGTSGGELLAPGQHSAGGCSDTASILRVGTATVGRGGGAGTSGGELLPAPPPAWGCDGVARIPPVAEGGGGAGTSGGEPLAQGQRMAVRGAEEAWGLKLTGGVEDAGRGPHSLHSVHFDANFKLNLIGHRYGKAYPQLSRRRFFVSNKRVLGVLNNAAASQPIGPTTCSKFDADKVVAAESKKDLITALGAALCRHGMLLRLINLFTGERHAYCTCTVESILYAETAIQFMWYDIACRWGRSYTKWLGEQQELTLKERGSGMVCLIPPWHRYAHSFQCQKAFGHLRVEGVGRGSGEPAEVWNSVVGALGNTTQYMAPDNRESHIERTGPWYNRHVLEDLPFRLWRMKTRAEGALQAVNHRIDDLERILAGASGKPLNEDRLQHLLQEAYERRRQQQQQQQQQRPQEEQRQGQQQSWEGEYIRRRLALEKLQRSDTVDAAADVVPLGLLFPGADSVSIRQRPALIRSLRAQVEEVERAHNLEQGDWVAGSQSFMAGLSSLARVEAEKLMLETEVGSHAC
ncbi:hypothetical protein Vretimale_6330 [Volvox reticuliferus]|uniref:CxC3 like cysteine cluster domain-containing protein n=1 Tax=Volvox reticuliferus TaxID=1737510 RepID=A0A8J4G7H1_9CHLO|nr:hypothetical protein Vretifemale_15917 [Volvox reticuliferus]GIM01541.1 hypothetical protein Vretimale_6330 [Volvox reticuliferus]